MRAGHLPAAVLTNEMTRVYRDSCSLWDVQCHHARRLLAKMPEVRSRRWVNLIARPVRGSRAKCCSWSVRLSVRPSSRVWGLLEIGKQRNFKFGGDTNPNKSKFEVKGHREWKYKHRFCAYLREKWIDLRQTKTNMIIGPFYTHCLLNIGCKSHVVGVCRGLVELQRCFREQGTFAIFAQLAFRYRQK